MATIISADNGSVSGSAGLKSSADSSGILQLQTGANVNALQIDENQYPSATINGLGKGLIPAEQFYRLNSTLTGSNATGAQSILGVGVTLVGSTVYQFEAVYPISKTAGTTSHTIGLSFGGTATLNNIAYELTGLFKSNGFTGVVAPDVLVYVQTASNTTVTASTTSASVQFIALLKGTVSVNVGGTFIPQYTLSSAPGGAYTAAIGTYFKISPLAASGANVNIGTWA